MPYALCPRQQAGAMRLRPAEERVAPIGRTSAPGPLLTEPGKSPAEGSPFSLGNARGRGATPGRNAHKPGGGKFALGQRARRAGGG